jgi:hypothetical protein
MTTPFFNGLIGFNYKFYYCNLNESRVIFKILTEMLK